MVCPQNGLISWTESTFRVLHPRKRYFWWTEDAFYSRCPQNHAFSWTESRFSASCPQNSHFWWTESTFSVQHPRKRHFWWTKDAFYSRCPQNHAISWTESADWCAPLLLDGLTSDLIMLSWHSAGGAVLALSCVACWEPLAGVFASGGALPHVILARFSFILSSL